MPIEDERHMSDAETGTGWQRFRDKALACCPFAKSRLIRQRECVFMKGIPCPMLPDVFSSFVPRSDDHPFIIAQLGQSLDGRIATLTGDSRSLGSSASLDHLHAIRAHVDAVLVGIGTVLADDPQLNLRRHPGTSPARLVIDAKGRLPPEARCLKGEDGARRIVFRLPETKAPALPEGVEIVILPGNGAGGFDLAMLPEVLNQLGFRRVLIEGGASIISQAMDADILDRLHLMVSPVIIGSGRQGLTLEPIHLMREARRPETGVMMLGGGEVLFDCNLRRMHQDNPM